MKGNRISTKIPNNEKSKKNHSLPKNEKKYFETLLKRWSAGALLIDKSLLDKREYEKLCLYFPKKKVFIEMQHIRATCLKSETVICLIFRTLHLQGQRDGKVVGQTTLKKRRIGNTDYNFLFDPSFVSIVYFKLF